jgi:hypothetical protein
MPKFNIIHGVATGEKGKHRKPDFVNVKMAANQETKYGVHHATYINKIINRN